jgi:hypothetical protein
MSFHLYFNILHNHPHHISKCMSTIYIFYFKKTWWKVWTFRPIYLCKDPPCIFILFFRDSWYRSLQDPWLGMCWLCDTLYNFTYSLSYWQTTIFNATVTHWLCNIFTEGVIQGVTEKSAFILTGASGRQLQQLF